MIITLFSTTICWSQVGHMIVAQIAYDTLKLKDIQVGNKFNDLLLSINKLTDNRSRTFAQSACWPDDLKSVGFLIFNHWHYYNSVLTTDITIPLINTTQAACNIQTILKAANNTLGFNTDNNTAQRALMARYLIHLVGDIHQPLHTVALYNATYPKGDQGGNLLKVKRQGGVLKNFHSFWDQGIQYFTNKTFFFKRPMDQQNFTQFTKFIQQIKKQYSYQSMQQQAENLNYNKWLQQGLDNAKTIIYPIVAKSNQISDDNINIWYQLCRKQVALGGYRLANLIISIYKPVTIKIN